MKLPSTKQKIQTVESHGNRQSLGQHFKTYAWLYIFIIPTMLYFLIFCYAPMGGIIMAFSVTPAL